MSGSANQPIAKEQSAADRYVVIARRYRPQAFEELVGQEHIARALQQAIAAGRVGHAYLFTGARGVGKTSAARILAKALNCERGPTPTPCNECDVCLRVSSGDDVDVLEIDGASNRGIDEIRQLRQNVAVRPSRVRYKIYIIDEVHMLTKEAFNALLKTLEEPPEHVKFIFATTEPQRIPITILSRCQRFDFAGISAAAIGARLLQIAATEGVEVEPEAVQILASRAAGSMRDSQSLLEQLLAAGHKRITAGEVTLLLGIAPAERLEGLVHHMVARDAAAALAELDATLQGGVEVGLLLDQLVGYFRDAMAVAAGCGTDQLLYALPSQALAVVDVGRKLGLSTVLAIGQILDQTAARMRVSMHGRTLVEMAIVRICQLSELDDLASLVAELRGSVGGAGTSRPIVASDAAKKNGESPRPALAPVVAPPELPTVAAPAVSRAQRIDSAHSQGAGESVSDAQAREAGLAAADSVLAQWQRAVANGSVAPSDPPPRTSRREQLAAIADHPMVRRAMELFDVPAGQFRYVPPDADKG
jgi:DNA polymerase-3 subunit gamma/tau